MNEFFLNKWVNGVLEHGVGSNMNNAGRLGHRLIPLNTDKLVVISLFCWETLRDLSKSTVLVQTCVSLPSKAAEPRSWITEQNIIRERQEVAIKRDKGVFLICGHKTLNEICTTRKSEYKQRVKLHTSTMHRCLEFLTENMLNRVCHCG